MWQVVSVKTGKAMSMQWAVGDTSVSTYTASLYPNNHNRGLVRVGDFTVIMYQSVSFVFVLFF